MTATPLGMLQAKLAEFRPQALLYLSVRPALEFAGDGGMAVTVRNDVARVADLANEQRYDCVLVADLLEHLPHAQGLALLGRLRNLHAGQLLVFVDHELCAEPWTLDDFLGQGCRQEGSATYAGRTLTLYSYDIATYNHERSWNNPRFWANPELWGKYFW